MKKRHLKSLTICCLLIFTVCLCSCGKETVQRSEEAEKAVQGFFVSLQDGDYQDTATYLTGELTTALAELQAAPAGVQNIVTQIMRKSTLTTTNSAVDKDGNGTVDIEIIMPDTAQLMQQIGDEISQTVTLSQLTSEDIGVLIDTVSQELLPDLLAQSFPTETLRTIVKVTKIDGQFKVDEAAFISEGLTPLKNFLTR